MLDYQYKIELNENSLKKFEYYLGKLEEDVYSLAEALDYMVGKGSTLGGEM
jgi:hypothetical protein